MTSRTGILLATALTALVACPVIAAEPVDKVYATENGQDLHLRLFLPQDPKDAPLVVFFHGGGWKAGSYEIKGMPWLTQAGYAVASVQYRFTKVAPFPAQIHDCKAALRWLGKHGKEYGIDASRVAVMGFSAGGHLSLLMAVTHGDKELEGKAGEHGEVSSRVVAAVALAGPSDFVEATGEKTPWNGYARGCIHGLLGGTAEEKPDVARQASPLSHVDKGDAALLIIHGRKDKVVPILQAERMAEAYRVAGLPVELLDLPDAGHNGQQLLAKPVREQVLAFLKTYLRGQQ